MRRAQEKPRFYTVRTRCVTKDNLGCSLMKLMESSHESDRSIHALNYSAQELQDTPRESLNAIPESTKKIQEQMNRINVSMTRINPPMNQINLPQEEKNVSKLRINPLMKQTVEKETTAKTSIGFLHDQGKYFQVIGKAATFTDSKDLEWIGIERVEIHLFDIFIEIFAQ